MQAETGKVARTLTIAIGPDAPVVSEGTAAMVERAAPDFRVIRLVDVDDGGEPVDVLLYDPERHALADLVNVRRGSPGALVVAFCWSTQPHIVDVARRDGAVAFLSKQLGADEVVAAIRALHAGHRDSYVILPGPNPRTASAPARPAGLSERELEVLRLIAIGYTNDEIARHLFLSINSVKTYIRSAYRKIGATRRTQAVLWGVEQGLASTVVTRFERLS